MHMHNYYIVLQWHEVLACLTETITCTKQLNFFKPIEIIVPSEYILAAMLNLLGLSCKSHF